MPIIVALLLFMAGFFIWPLIVIALVFLFTGPRAKLGVVQWALIVMMTFVLIDEVFVWLDEVGRP